ncbi:MAG: arsenic resistance protein [Eubacteriaceae bacterium]|jgi:ACR3 family arsenite transporter
MKGFLDKFERIQPLLVLAAAGIGLLIGQNPVIAESMGGLEDPILMVLLFFIFLDADYNEISSAIKNFKFTGTAVLMNFVWTPLFAALLANTILAGQHELQTALLLLLVMPCTDWYLVFTGLSGGNVPLSSALLPINLVLQLLLLPVYLTLFTHGGVGFDFWSIAVDLASVILIPLILALITRFMLIRSKRLGPVSSWLESKGEVVEFTVMMLVVLTIFASEGQGLFENPQLYPMMLLAICIFYPVNFCLAFFLGKKTGLSWRDRVSLIFTTTARNSPLSLTLAALIFPEEPLISLALLIGPVTELPISAIETWVLKVIRDKHHPEEIPPES